MVLTYYNEIDPYCVRWLNNLMDVGLISEGYVDSRPVQELPDDAAYGYVRQHYFAGIAVWEIALRLAGWPTDLPVTSGSCPCQPFSAAGKQQGKKDKRHLWPDWYTLLAINRPGMIFGEQVASGPGRIWLDTVRINLNTLGYGFFAADLPAAALGAPHIRQRLFWAAFLPQEGKDGRAATPHSHSETPTGQQSIRSGVQLPVEGMDSAVGVDDTSTQSNRSASVWRHEEATTDHKRRDGAVSGVADSGRIRRYIRRRTGQTGTLPSAGNKTPKWTPLQRQTEGHSIVGGMGDPDDPGLQGRSMRPVEAGKGSQRDSVQAGFDFWNDSVSIPCADQKTRRIESGTFPLVDGSAFRLDESSALYCKSRTGLIKAYGNAIVPQVAAVFISTVMEYLEIEPCYQ